MISFGKKAEIEYLTCLNHTINLAVIETIFPKTINLDEISDESDSEELIEQIFSVEESFRSTVAKMKATINCFRKSPLKNNHLHAEIDKQNIKPLELILFTKTRWNSLVISGRRFLDLLPAVTIVLKDLDSNLSWTEENTDLLKVGCFAHILIRSLSYRVFGFVDAYPHVRTISCCYRSFIQTVHQHSRRRIYRGNSRDSNVDATNNSWKKIP